MVHELTTEDAARILGVTQSRVRQLLCNGELNGRKLRRRNGRIWDWIISIDDISVYSKKYPKRLKRGLN